MRQEVKSCVPGRGLGERDGIGDRARPERWMIEGVDPVVIGLEQRGHQLRVLGPELAERAGRLAEGSVDQNQRRPVVSGDSRLVAPLEWRERVRLQPIHAGIDLRIERLDDLRCNKVGRLVLDDPGENVKGPHLHVAKNTARAARQRRCVLKTPLQSAGYAHLSRAERGSSTHERIML